MVAAVVEAGLELVSAFFAVGRAISGNEPTFSGFEASSDFLVSAFASFLVSAFASLLSVAAALSATSDFSVAEADASEVTAELERSTFGACAPSA